MDNSLIVLYFFFIENSVVYFKFDIHIFLYNKIKKNVNILYGHGLSTMEFVLAPIPAHFNRKLLMPVFVSIRQLLPYLLWVFFADIH
jgi:hypothetical protein